MSSSPVSAFPVGSLVTIKEQPPFIKTADPMPMLRSGSLAAVGSLGQIVEQRRMGYYVVHLSTGIFLIDQRYLHKAPATPPS